LSAICEHRRFLRGCDAAATAVCQYCGRDFCEVHGVTLDDGQEICLRSRCQEKRVDVERFFAYKERVAERNRSRRCGEPACERQAALQCSKCQGLFCGRHLEEREVEEGRGLATVRVRAVLCPYCQGRLPLWSRR